MRASRNKSGAHVRRYLIALLAMAGLAEARPAWCELPREPVVAPEAFYGQPLKTLSIEASPREDVARLGALVGLEPGMMLQAASLRRAVKVLYQLGRFENVFVHGRLVPGGVALRLELPPRQTLVSLRLEESDLPQAFDLEEGLGLSRGSELGSDTLKEARRRLLTVLEARGYRSAEVVLSLAAVDRDGGRELEVRIKAGVPTRLERLVIEGAPRMPLWQVDRWIGLTPGDVLDLDRVKAAIERLRQAYVDRGFLEVSIGRAKVREVETQKGKMPRAVLMIRVEAGPRVALRFAGHRAILTRELAEDGALLAELGTGPAALSELKERILARYEKRGYWRARVEAAVRVTSSRDKKDILVTIAEGPASKLGRLTFPGNTALEPRLLEETVFEAVEQALVEERGRPGAHPATVHEAFGDRTLQTRRRNAGPSTASPHPRSIYVPRAYRAAAELIADAFRAEGYQRVAVDPPVVVERRPGFGDRGAALVDVQIPVRPGVRWMVGAVSFSGHEAVGGAKLLELARLDPARSSGQPLAFTQVEEARRAILAHYRGLGHLYASVVEDLRQVPPRGSLSSWGYVSTSSVAPLDVRSVCARAEAKGEPSCAVELVFRIHEGPEVKARDIVVRGLEATRAEVVESELTVTRGAVLREQDLLSTRDNLLRLGIFERVTVRPIDEEETAREKDVVIEVKERRPHVLELGVGASTEEGVRAVASYSDVNVGGTALRFQLRSKLNVWLPQLLLLYDAQLRDRIDSFYDQFGTLGRLEYELAAGLAYPRIFGLPRGFSAGIDLIAFRDYDPAFAENTQTLLLMGTYKGLRPLVLGRPRPIALQLRTKFERSALQCNPEINDRPELCSTSISDQRNLRIEGTNAYVTLGPRVSFDLRDDPLDPTSGAYLEIDASFSKGLEEKSPDLASLFARANAFLPLFDRSFTLVFSFLASKVFPLRAVDASRGLDIPVNRRLFAGGRSSVRGYPEKTLLPQDVALDPISGEPVSAISAGGLLSMALKSELRVPLFSSLSLAIFYDVGDLFESGRFAIETRTPLADGREVVRTLAQGAGLGLRVATPIGPLAIDFAVPMNPRDPGATDPQLHFSVGNF